MRALPISKKQSLIGGSVILFLVASLLVWSPWAKSTGQDENGPPFHAVTPGSKSVDKFGGWQKMTPPDGSELYIYTDTLNDISISVSQQALPDSFKNDVQAKVSEVAKGYNATNKLEAGPVTAYIGTSAKGPQSVLFVKHDALILIKSQQVIPNDIWVAYINSLK